MSSKEAGDGRQVRALQGRRREVRFRLKASNCQIIDSGEAYETRARALKGIQSVRNNAGDAALDDQTG